MDAWLDRSVYPFTSHYLEVDAGRMHYVDEGDGEPIVMLHGNPTWSFLYRHLVHHLAPAYRCVAPDYLGFGLSDKPAAWSYLPEQHARHVRQLIDQLGLEDLTLVVQDWGGPIGLSYALDQPANVKRLVLINTWMWPLKSEMHFVVFSKLMGGSLGRFLTRRFNFFANVVVRQAFGDKQRLTREAHRHYLKPLDAPDKRKGSWVFPRELIGSTPWLSRLWERRQNLTGLPILIVWGLQDPAFREQELDRWCALFPNATVHRLENIGHYVQEEMGPALGPIVATFLHASP